MSERPLAELLGVDEPAWPTVAGWIDEAVRPVRVVPVEATRGEHALHRLQITAASPLGAIALNTAGIVVDDGWLRLLGAGSADSAGLLAWNGLEDSPIEHLEHAFVVAHDAIGGFFALNGGAFGGPQHNVFACLPDALDWTDLGTAYSGFVHWAVTGDVAGFYADLRWDAWQRETADLAFDEGLFLYPPPFTREGKDVSSAHRGRVPMHELWTFYCRGGYAERLDLAQQ